MTHPMTTKEWCELCIQVVRALHTSGVKLVSLRAFFFDKGASLSESQMKATIPECHSNECLAGVSSFLDSAKVSTALVNFFQLSLLTLDTKQF